MTLSVIIITKNEAANITECIASASFANEIIIVDSGSTDETLSIALNLGAKVFKTDWQGFGFQKNRAIDFSTGDWIFSLDADERIPINLKNEIQQAITQTEFYVFDVPRHSLFISKFMKYSGWYPDRTKRLFKRDSARFSANQVHEHLETNKKTGHLNTALVHYSYRDYETLINKMNLYSTAGALDFNQRCKKSSLSKAIAHGTWAFIRTYFIKLGFLDGSAGLILAIANAETTYYKYVKLIFLQSRTDVKNPTNPLV